MNSNEALHPLSGIPSKYTIRVLFSYMKYRNVLRLFKYSKKYQDILKIGLSDYKLLSSLNSSNDPFKGKQPNFESLKDQNTYLLHKVDTCNCDYTSINHTVIFNDPSSVITAMTQLRNSDIILGTNTGYIIKGLLRGFFDEPFKAHRSKITSIIELTNGTIVTASTDCNIKFFNPKWMNCEKTLTLIRGVQSLLEYDATQLITASNQLVVWNLEQEYEFIILPHYGSTYSLIKYGKNNIALGSSVMKTMHFPSQKIKLYQNYSEDIKEYKGSAFRVKGLVHLEPHFIASAEDKIIKMWNLSNGKCEYTLEGHHSNIITMVKMSEKVIVSGGEDYIVNVWNLEDMTKSIQILTFFSEMIVKIIPNGDNKLIVASENGLVISFKVEGDWCRNDGEIDYYKEVIRNYKKVKVVKNLIRLRGTDEMKKIPSLYDDDNDNNKEKEEV